MIQLRAGDTDVSGRVATSSLDKLAEGKTGVISWCASCHVQFTETTIPTVEKVRGSRPFEMTPFMLFLKTRFEDLRPMLKNPVPMRIALHKHPGVKGVVEAGTELLRMVPGIEIVDLHQPAVGLMSNALNASRTTSAAFSLRNWKPPRPPASTPWWRFITSTIASYARTSGTGRSALSIFWTLSAPAWGFTTTIISSA